MRVRLIPASVLGLALALLAVGAKSSCITSTTVAATGLAFGTINPFVLPVDSTATLTLTYTNTGSACNANAVVTLVPTIAGGRVVIQGWDEIDPGSDSDHAERGGTR